MAAESKIEKAVCTYAKKKGFYVRKFVSTSHRGVPDQLFISPNGVTFFIEFKAPNKKPTAMQLDEHRQIERCNVVVHVVDDVEEGKRVIDYYG